MGKEQTTTEIKLDEFEASAMQPSEKKEVCANGWKRIQNGQCSVADYL